MQPDHKDPRIASLAAVAAAWNEAGIDYGVAHGIEDYPAKVGRDLDVMVTRADIDRARQIAAHVLQDEGYAVAVPPNPWSAQALFAFRGDTAIEIDLIPWLFIGPALLVNGAHATDSIGPFVMDDWASFAKRVLMYMMGGRDPKLPYWVPEQESLIKPHCEQLFGEAITADLFAALQAEDMARLRTLAPVMRKTMLRRAVLHRPLEAARMLGPWLGVKIRPYFTRRAPIVALAGPDGIGKTTTTDAFVNVVPDVFVGVERRHWRPSVLPRLGKLAGKNVHHDEEGTAPLPRREAGRLPWVRVAYYMLDYVLGHFFQDRRQSSELKMICYDRYAADMVVDPVRYGLPTEQGARLLHRTVPLPDLTVLFSDDPERIYARKQELTVDEIDTMQQRWFEMADEGGVDAIIRVDAPAEEIAARLNALTMQSFIYEHRVDSGGLSAAVQWLSGIFTEGYGCRMEIQGDHIMNGHTYAQTLAEFGWLEVSGGRGYLLPLESAKAAVGALRLYPAQSSKARLARRALAMGLRSGMARRMLPVVQITMADDSQTFSADDVYLLDHLRTLFDQSPIYFGVSLGAPGPHRKPVLCALSDDGEALAYVRVGHNEVARGVVAQETEVLSALHGYDLTAFAVPQLLHDGVWHGRRIGVQSAPTGDVKQPSQTLAPQYQDAVREMASIRQENGPLLTSDWWRALEAQVDAVDHVYYRHVLDLGMAKAKQSFEGGSLPLHLAHGDMTPWNAVLQDGDLFLFDWEAANWAAPPGWDLIHFAVQTMWRLEGVSPGALASAFRTSSTTRSALETHLQALHVSPDMIMPLYELYLTAQIAAYARHDATNVTNLQYLAMALNLSMYQKQETPV